MGSIIIKFFTGMIAMMIAHRLISTILAIAFCFLLYKFFTDPRSLTKMFENLREMINGFGGAKIEKVKDLKDLALLTF